MVSLNLPSYPPPEEPEIFLFLERSLFAGFAIVMFTYGVFVTLTLACLYAMLFHPLHGKRHWMLISFIILLFLGSTVFIVTNYIWSQLTWIDARGYPGGPPAFFAEQFGCWINVVSNCALAFNNFLLDALLLWRCFVIWQRKAYIVVIPFLAWAATAVFAVLTIIESAKPGATDPFLTTKFATPYFAICLGLNVALTGLIVSRLLFMRSQVSSLGKHHSRVFTSMAALIIDSALPYTLVSIFAIITVTYTGEQHVQFASAFSIPLVGGILWIVSMCILLRAAVGRGFEGQTTGRPAQSGGWDFRSPTRPMSTMFLPMQNGHIETKIVDNLEDGDKMHTVRIVEPFSETSSEMTIPTSPRQTYHLPSRVGERRPQYIRSQEDIQNDYQQRLAYDKDEPLIQASFRN